MRSTTYPTGDTLKTLIAWECSRPCQHCHLKGTMRHDSDIIRWSNGTLYRFFCQACGDDLHKRPYELGEVPQAPSNQGWGYKTHMNGHTPRR